MEDEVTRWAIILLGATAASVGLATRFVTTKSGKDWCAIIAFVSTGTALIISQA